MSFYNIIGQYFWNDIPPNIRTEHYKKLFKVPITLKDPSHPLYFACFEDDMRHFRCHRNSSFLQCEFKSFYILPNTAHSGLNSPSTRSQTISGFIFWIICELFVIFRIKSVTQTRECNRTSLWFESQLKQHSRSSIESSLEDLLDYFPR